MGIFEGFVDERIAVEDVVLRVRHGGEGTPVLLVHGHPRTGATWHDVAARLVSAGFSVVCPDMRGYGQSTAPSPLPDHSQQSKRAVASDLVQVMRALGHDTFALAGHDRGCYVALRLALDHPHAVTRLAVLDGVPISEALARADAEFARRWYHWFFFAVPEKPERAIGADPQGWYGGTADHMGEEAFAEYRAAIMDPDTRLAMLEDYRAGLGVDRDHELGDRDEGRTVECPTLFLWSARDDLEDLYGDPLEIWRSWAPTVTGHNVDSGHHMAEENPGALAAELARFFADA
ncbi:alpha/beta fold hydrolase [Pedococcus sp. 5OH_020]|uniref:alpha/beta fold hydrolase n=1 Tax=Pedococcus sp. 5OH_020 TaxID=2989814 RepID=UPI0022E9B64C|nr:alpha/beta hydrolase [Pedococcus sp. 5OH_020]